MENKIYTEPELENKEYICKECKDSGKIFDKKTGEIHTCFSCLINGRLNNA